MSKLHDTKQTRIPLTAISAANRRRVEYEEVEELAKEIDAVGLAHPIAVKDNGDGTYRLLAGGRRMKAFEVLGWKDAPCHVFSKDLLELEARSIELSENLFRKNLKWQEECDLKAEIHGLQVSKHGEKIARSKDAVGWSRADTSEMIGESKSSTSEDINLAEAMKIFPELAKCETKAEAKKLVRNLIKTVDKREKVKEIEHKKATTHIDVIHKALSQCYIAMPYDTEKPSSEQGFFEAATNMEDGSFGFVEVDPPYAVELVSNKKSTDRRSNLQLLEYIEVTSEDYHTFMGNVFRECFRVMKPDAWIICWCGSEWLNRIQSWMTEAGFKIAKIPAVWVKKRPGQAQSPNYLLGSGYEMFVYARRGTPEIQQKGRSNVFAYEPMNPHVKIHPTEKPIELYSEIVRTFCGLHDDVLIPFAGSGKMILAAANAGLHAVAYDLSSKYRDGFVELVYEGSPGGYVDRKSVAKKEEKSDKTVPITA